MFRHLRVAALAIPLALALAPPAHAGPPWLSVEYPANPHDPTTRGALAVVHTYHHGAQVTSAFSAEAVGLLNGRRMTVGLDVTPTSRPGAYAVRGSLPPGGNWVLVVTRQNEDGRARATALIALAASGEILTVRVPHDRHEGGRWLVPRSVTPDEVDAMLRRTVALSSVGAEVAWNDATVARERAPSSSWLATALLLIPAGFWAFRRRLVADSNTRAADR